MKQLDEASQMSPVALRGEHRRPACVIIFVADVAAAVARVEDVQPRGYADASERAGEQYEC